jgi:hypothetical protein
MKCGYHINILEDLKSHWDQLVQSVPNSYSLVGFSIIYLRKYYYSY